MLEWGNEEGDYNVIGRFAGIVLVLVKVPILNKLERVVPRKPPDMPI